VIIDKLQHWHEILKIWAISTEDEYITQGKLLHKVDALRNEQKVWMPATKSCFARRLGVLDYEMKCMNLKCELPTLHTRRDR
jgi:hypothetical protein